MRAWLAACAVSIALAAPAGAQENLSPREVAQRVAQQVEENFFDEARARLIAEEMRQAASAGRYDAAAAPLDLASALTATLAPHDGHFRVEWSPPGESAGPSPRGGPDLGAAARGNYGVAGAVMHPGGVGVIDLRVLSHFTPDNADVSPERAAMDAALTMASNAQAVILDVRDCAGGSPAMVGYLVAYFTQPGADIFNTFRGRDGESSEAPLVQPPRRMLDAPLFVVTSGRTASACESVAYTLQAAGRATVVGEPSAGGANPGGYIPVGGGFRVFVSGATPINPITHANWEGAGVPVDVPAPAVDAVTRAYELALQAAAARAADDSARREAEWALAALQAARASYPRDLRQYAGVYGARTVAIENGRLVLRRDRRPQLRLLPLERDLFAVDGAAPLQRVRFERDGRGRVTALVLTLVSGQEFRDTRAG